MDIKLAGTLFVYNGNRYDYSFKEAIKSLLEFCDKVFVVTGGEDKTFIDCASLLNLYEEKLYIIKISKEQWDEQRGREKLNYFTNIAIREAEIQGYEYQFNLQADEIVHEKSYDIIRAALFQNEEAFMCNRINLWNTPYEQLNVPQERKPCSTSIIRLTKTKYRSVGDAENIAVPIVNHYFEEDIRIYHMGFVRDFKVMKAKVINMQCGVFEMDNYDEKLNGSDIFIPERWFGKDDLIPIQEPLPKIIREWAEERFERNKLSSCCI